MEDVINVVNQLQEVFNASGKQFDIDLPQVVVVGTQSSGKSSVLEHLVGKSFLPRGSGIVTRCPLVLQLSQSKDEREYVVFKHDDTKIFTDYSLVCKEIEQQTDRLAGANKGICSTPIFLKLFSPSHLDLTLVDLPGLTKVPVGDQPDDIDEQTKELILEYVKNPKSIILAVIPANADMATSDSLKISRDVDPKGKRTLAVVTKLDIMDKGTDAVEMLTGNIIPVKLGIIGVVNRSQKDILEGKSIKDSLKDEADFFSRKYENIALQHGTNYLKKSVQRILINHIKTCLPGLSMNVSQQLVEKRLELQYVAESKLDNTVLLLDLIGKFSSNFISTIKGDLKNIPKKELHGGAKINKIFQTTLYNDLICIEALKGLTYNDIDNVVKNATGINPPLFIPQKSFELLIKEQLKPLRSPCLVCINLVRDELINITQHCLQDQDVGLFKYPKLKQVISDITTDLIQSSLPKTNEMVNSFMDEQIDQINTAHPEFSSNKHLQNTGSTPIDRNRTVSLMNELIKSYFSIIVNITHDAVPKKIKQYLVDNVNSHLQNHLIKEILTEDQAGDLLEESQEVVVKRKCLESSIDTLESANKILNSLSTPHMLV